MVASFETEEEILTIVGYLPFVNSGDTLKAIGKYVTHQDYGRQFKVETFEKMMPETNEALEAYLANGMIKGVGPVTAKKIVEKFGEETIHVLKFEPEKLAQIRGIKEEKALEISASFVANWEVWQIVGFLNRFGVEASSANRIYKELGNNAIREIEQNPYILIDIAKNADFKKIDKMALDLGYESNNDKRIKSGIKYSLNIISYNGHTCVAKENLITFVRDLLNVKEDEIENCIIDLKAKQEIIIEEREDTNWVYLDYFYKAEQNISEKLKALDKADNLKRISKFKSELKRIEKKSNIELSEKQKEALEKINDNNVCVITGGPGTGKTTIIKSIIDLYDEKKKKVVLCAPTGRAAKRMSETTGKEAKTLHRLLEIGKYGDEQKNEINLQITPIDADIVIVDEMSMVDMFLMNYLLKGIYLGTKLILVGDVDQLASVGPGSVLKDIIASEKIETVRLDKIFRQAAKSKIIVNAHKVNNGEKFVVENREKNNQEENDFFYIKESIQEKILYHVLSLSKDRLKKYADYDFFRNIQVITPTKKGMLGTKELNQSLQAALNPKDASKNEKTNPNTIYREGDRVMQTKNNYDMFWEKREPVYETGSGVYNGELGIIEKIDNNEKVVKIKFDDEKVAWYEFQDLEQIELAYAVTIHKAQGSEFDVVIMPITQSAPALLTRNLLYTGITRAKKMLVIVGNNKVIDFMIENVDSKKRNTGLEYKLRAM